MTSCMIGQFFLVVLAESQFDFSFFYQLIEEACSQEEMVLCCLIVQVQQMTIFIPHCKCTGRRRGNDFHSFFRSSSDGFQIEFSLTGSLLRHTIGNKSYSTTFLLIKQLHSISYSIHHLDKILTQLREVVVDIASMEITYLLSKFLLR